MKLPHKKGIHNYLALLGSYHITTTHTSCWRASDDVIKHSQIARLAQSKFIARYRKRLFVQAQLIKLCIKMNDEDLL